MARHETEMRRQRDDYRETLVAIRRLAKAWDENRQPIDLPGMIMAIDAVIKRWCPTRDLSLFADRDQMDLQDRKDI
jgi:hypothetical protein